MEEKLVKALTELANYFEVHTADSGRTTRGNEVLEQARTALYEATTFRDPNTSMERSIYEEEDNGHFSDAPSNGNRD